MATNRLGMRTSDGGMDFFSRSFDRQSSGGGSFSRPSSGGLSMSRESSGSGTVGRSSIMSGQVSWPYVQKLGDSLRCTIECEDDSHMLDAWRRVQKEFDVRTVIPSADEEVFPSRSLRWLRSRFARLHTPTLQIPTTCRARYGITVGSRTSWRTSKLPLICSSTLFSVRKGTNRVMLPLS